MLGAGNEPTLRCVTRTPSQTIPAEERQVNLLLPLRNTATGMTAAEVVDTVAGYDRSGGETARRMFERDKRILRELGIVITTTGQDEGSRYRVAEEDYALPDVSLTAEEAAAIDLAASAWRSGALTSTARHALTKIRAVTMGEEDTGVDRSRALADLTVDLAGREVPPLLAAAVDERRVVSFDYTSAASGTTRTRVVDPHRLRMSEGAWYLDAFDLGSQATRTFRLTRIAGKVSVRSDPGAFAPPEDGEPLAREALVAVAPGRALHLRSRATAADPGTDSRPVPVGWDVLKVTYTDRVAFAGSLAALADAAVVMDPPQLRADVVAHLTGVAALGLPTEDR